MTLAQLLLIAAAVAVALSPTLRVIAQYLVQKLADLALAEVRKAMPNLSDAVSKATPSIIASGTEDLHTVLDLAARLQTSGKPDAVKMCQQLIDQMLQPKP